MPEPATTSPMTAQRIREAGDLVEMDASLWDFIADVWPTLAPVLAALLRRMADAVHNLEMTGYRDGEDDQALVVPELRALVLAIEGAAA